MPEDSRFGPLLRRYRVGAGLSQAALAERAGLADTAIAALERGRRRRPYPETVQRLAKALSLSSEERAALLVAARPTPEPERAEAAAAQPAARGAPAASGPARSGIGSLPAPVTSFVGRTDEVARVASLLAGARLLTLTGPGGCGKTRLALAVAEQVRENYPDGVAFVDLSSVVDANFVTATIAQALDLHEYEGKPLAGVLGDFLRDKRLLLVLDNCEQVVAAAPLLSGLLAACPGLTLLVTSRVLLRLSGEREYVVPPLPLPDHRCGIDPISLQSAPAVALFVQRAQAARMGFALTDENVATVAEICTRLDGLPLALELAAARVRILSPRALLARLEARLPLLIDGPRDAPARQQTLRNTIAWSYDLLAPVERALFRWLGVFADGCTLEAVTALLVTASSKGVRAWPGPQPTELSVLDGLASLVRQSLLREEDGPEGEPRFLLLATVREFALEQLDAAGEAEAVRAAHAAWCLALAERSVSALRGPDQGTWLAHLEREISNLRAALRWANAEDACEIEARLAVAIAPFMSDRAYLTEGRRTLAPVLARPADTIDPALRRRALLQAGKLAQWQGDLEGAEASLAECLSDARTAGDRAVQAEALAYLGLVHMRRGAPAEAVSLLDESLALSRRWGDDLARALALLILGTSCLNLAELQQARTLLTECLQLYERAGDVRYAAVARTQLGVVARNMGDRERAVALLRQGLVGHIAVGDRTFMGIGLRQIAATTADTMPRGAARLLGAAEALRDVLGAAYPPSDRATDERTLTTIRARLSAAEAATAWAEGRGLTMEQAVSEAQADMQAVGGASSREVPVSSRRFQSPIPTPQPPTAMQAFTRTAQSAAPPNAPSAATDRGVPP